MKKIYPLILCGGTGTRLWPLSRTRSPKQFQKIGGQDSLTFFQAAVQRHRGDLFFDPCVVTSLRHRGTVVNQLREIQSGFSIICEPMGRNTGPAVLAAAHALNGRDPNAVILVIPADHIIEGDINAAIEAQLEAVQAGKIVCLGIPPRGPETGFGYIVGGEEVEETPGLRMVDRFVEKPPRDVAEELIKQHDALWASGISMFAARTIIEEYERHDPESADHVRRSVVGASLFPEALYLDADDFSQADAQPTEMAVFEKSDRMAIAPLNVRWSDVGSWSAMYEVQQADENGNVLQGDVVALDTKNTMVRSENRLVSVIGLSDVIVVDTVDALLVTHRDRSQHVKDMVEKLKSKRRPEAEYYAGAAPKMVPVSMKVDLEQIMQTDNFQLGTSQLPVGACTELEQGNGRQMIVMKGSVHAQGPTWQKTVREGGRIYSDPDGEIRITNCADVETELLFMTFDSPVDTPKSIPLENYG